MLHCNFKQGLNPKLIKHYMRKEAILNLSHYKKFDLGAGSVNFSNGLYIS